jgi:hypothetical protein
VVVAEGGALARQFGHFGHRARVGERAHETQDDPTAGGNMQVKRATGHNRQAEPRNRIAEIDMMNVYL